MENYQNVISINQEKETDVDRVFTIEDFKNDLIIQKGKKVFVRVKFDK